MAISLLALAGCGSPAPTATSSPPAAPTAATAPVTTSGPPAAAVPVDPSLLDVLPEEVDGLAIQPSPESDLEAAADPAVKDHGEGVVTAIAADPASGSFVYAVVVRLRPDAFAEGLFRQWRDTFDAGACSQAGGVDGHAEAGIDGRTVYIGSCAGGVMTHHVWLPERRLLVSSSSAGDRRLGEKLMAGLRP